MSSLRACSSSSSRVLTPRFLVITSSPSGWGSSGLCDSSGGDSCLCGVTTLRSPCLVLVCVLPYVTLPVRGVRVGVRLHLCGQGLRLALRCSGARFHCRARLCAATSLWARIALASPWFWSSCSLPCAWVCGYVFFLGGARIALVFPCIWCSGSLPCALVCGYVHMGKDCACLSVFLVLVFTAVCDLISATARVGVRIRLMGKDCACLSVVLVLSAIARVGLGYGSWARISLVSLWSWCSSPLRALVCGAFFWARIALASPWSWCSAPLRALICGYGLWARIVLVSPWSWYSCVQCRTSSASRSAA